MGYPVYVVAMIRYVEEHITEGKIDYKRLEKEIGFSKAHIRTLFRQSMGCPKHVLSQAIKGTGMYFWDGIFFRSNRSLPPAWKLMKAVIL